MRVLVGMMLLVLSVYAGDTFVPAVTSEAVDGAAQRIGLKVRNLETRPVQVRFSLLRVGDGEPLTAERSLDPLSTLSLTDGLNELFPGSDAAGSLKISADGATLTSAVRLFQKETRTYGLGLAALPAEALITTGGVADAPWLPTSELWGSVLWLLLDGETTATLVAYDALGNELGRNEIQGTSQTLRFAPSELVQNPPEVMRVQIRIKSGRAAAFAETVLKSTGDRSGYQTVEISRLPTIVAFQPAMRLPILQGFALASIIMFNPWASPQTVTLSFGGRNSNVTLKPFEVREVVDVLSTLFGQTETASVLYATSGWPVFLIGRSDIRPSAAGQTTAAEMSLATDPDEINGAGTTTYFLPPEVPEAGLAFITVTREEASRGTLQREGLAGLPEGSPGSYDLPDFVFWQTLLNLVVPGVNGSTPVVVLKPETGGVDATVQSFLPVSGDPIWVKPLAAQPVEECSPPAISRLLASAYTLAVPGSVDLTWSIEDAESVELLPAGATLNGSGTLSVAIEASTEFTFRASNACGTTEAPLLVSVGAPRVISASAGPAGETRSHGAPGELLALTFENLTEPELIESLTVTAQGVAVPVTILRRGEAGEVFALVPYMTAGATQPVQVTGGVEIRAVLASGETSKPVPFTIDALSGEGDSVAEARALFDRINSWTAEMAATLRAQGFTDVDALEANAAKAERALREAVASIDTTGKAMVGWNELPAGHPDAIAVEVTRADLAALMAYNRNAGLAWRALLGAEEGEPAEAAARRLSQMPRDAGGTCLVQKVKLLQPCLANDYRRKFEAAMAEQVDDLLKDIDKDLPTLKEPLAKYLKDKLAKKIFAAMIKRVYKWLDHMTVACMVAPIQLKEFEVETQGRLISASPRRNRPLRSKEVLYSEKDFFTVVRVMAILVPEIPDGDVKTRARSLELKAFRAGLKARGVDDRTAELATDILDKTVESDPLLDELVRIAQKYRTTTRDQQQVGSCDLENVYPKLNGPGAVGNPDQGYSRRRSVLKLHTGRQSGEDDYFYIGKKIGRRESLCIIPRPANFLFNDDATKVEARRLKNDPCAFHKEVTIRSGRAVVARQRDATAPLSRQRIYSDRVFVGPGEARAVVLNAAVGAPAAPGQTATPPINTVFVNTELDRETPYVRKDGGGPATARIEAKQTDDLTWTMKLNSAGHQEPLTLDNGERRFNLWTAYSMMELSVTYPTPPREVARRVVLTGKTQTDDLCQMFIRLGDGTQNKSVSGEEGSLSLNLESSGPINIITARVNVYYPNRGFSGPFVAKSGSCSGEVELKIIEDESDPPGGG